MDVDYMEEYTERNTIKLDKTSVDLGKISQVFTPSALLTANK
jgi:hypothetical protein